VAAPAPGSARSTSPPPVAAAPSAQVPVRPRAAPPGTGLLEAARGSRRRWMIAASLLVAGAALLALALGALAGREPRTPTALAPPDAGPPPDAAPAVAARSLAPCPPEMRLVPGRRSVCIDAHEAPGEGALPATGVTLAQAREACAARGKRLCRAEEWERACRGDDGASWPYGDRYVADRCNLRGGKDAALARAGAFPGCVSAVGAFDMSGNAAEWVDEGQVRGASMARGGNGRCSSPDRRAPDQPAADVGYRCCAEPGAY
jgi:hypothetical protein